MADKKSKITALLCACFFVFTAKVFSYSFEFTPGPLSEFFFELTCGTVTGIYKDSSLEQFRPLTKEGAVFLMIPFITENGCRRLYEFIYPQKIGVIESVCEADDLIVAPKETLSQIDVILLYWNSQNQKDFADGTDILSMLEGSDGSENPEESKSKEPVEVINVDREGGLRKFSFDGEQVSFQTFNDFNVFVNAADDKVTREFYDTNWNLSKKEIYNNPAKTSQLKLKKSIEYFYDGEQKLKSTTEENKEDMTQTQIEYNSIKKPVLSNAVVYKEISRTPKEIENNKPIEYREVPLFKKEWVYDEKNRLVEFNSETYTFTDENFKKKEVSFKKYEYQYDKMSENPDTYYYEENKLRVKTEYTSQTSYNETLYFDSSFSVLTQYEDGFKTLEVIYSNGVELRRKTFDKPSEATVTEETAEPEEPKETSEEDEAKDEALEE
ncbi:MAG: hypothetical protein K6B73_05465 [Treponema sp.]|nr:hypothetical protein [Treponema sp.]